MDSIINAVLLSVQFCEFWEMNAVLHLPPSKTRYRTFPSCQKVSPFQSIPYPCSAATSVWLLTTIVCFYYFLDFKKEYHAAWIFGGKGCGGARVYLILLSVRDFIFINTVVYISDSLFSFLNCWVVFHCVYVYTYKYHDLFTHSPFDRHLDYFQVFTIMNKVGMNILVPVLLWTYVFIFLGEIFKRTC